MDFAVAFETGQQNKQHTPMKFAKQHQATLSETL